MGYLDLNAAYADAAPLDTLTHAAAIRGEAAEFSPLEWTTILLARRDNVASLTEPGRVRRFLGRFFGLDRKPGLADSRLEALRRFAVHAWTHGYNAPKSEFLTFKAAGFTPAQAETLLASVAVARSERGR